MPFRHKRLTPMVLFMVLLMNSGGLVSEFPFYSKLCS